MTSSRPRAGRRLVGPAAIVLLMATSHVARAQRTAADIESARQAYNQGMELKEKGDLKGALEKFRAAHALGNTPVTGIELCRVHAELRQPVEAREVCLGVARIPPLPQETQRSQSARAEAAQIAEAQKAKIGNLRLRIVGVPPGREPTVTVDNVAVPAAALGEPRAVNPGVHVVTAKVGRGAETRATLETREGETKDLELAVQPPPADEPPPPPPGGGAPVAPPPEKKKSSLGTVSFAVAGVAGAVGTVAGLVAISAKADLDDNCPNQQCGRDYHDDLDSARAAGTVSTVAFVITGVALAAGLVVSLTSASRSGSAPAPTRQAETKAKPSIGFGLTGIHGSF